MSGTMMALIGGSAGVLIGIGVNLVITKLKGAASVSSEVHNASEVKIT